MSQRESRLKGLFDETVDAASRTISSPSLAWRRLDRRIVLLESELDKLGRTQAVRHPLFACSVNAAYLLSSAALLAASGQLSASFQVARVSTEAAALAVHFHAVPSAAGQWFSRPPAWFSKDNPELAKMRRDASRELSFKTAVKSFPDELTEVGSELTDIYELCIDLGGHFNVPAAMVHLEEYDDERDLMVRLKTNPEHTDRAASKLATLGLNQRKIARYLRGLYPRFRER